jgi:SulP family sulfate permease
MTFMNMKRFFPKINLHDYIPKLFTCLKEGYNRQLFFHDLQAGITIGIITLPLALAFAIGSGVTPERGLFTAIVAGFLISLLGGSRVQIGGPTGAFVIVVYTVVQKHGYDGLALATIIAGLLMVIMGFARFGVLLKFIPHSVTTGFTTGLALAIFTTQLKDFFGLEIANLPPHFLEKCRLYCIHAHTWNSWAVGLGLATLIVIFALRRFFPKFPGAILAIAVATLAAILFEIPLETIESKFGAIPRMLPEPALPTISYVKIREVFPDAITIALLGAIESLLSAVIADGMTGHRHRSNCELVAQGFANIGSIIFGGIPATGAIARTAANVRLGAKTPIAGMIHAVTLLLLMLLLAPLAGKIPLAVLSAVLIFVAWNMSELPHFIEVLKGEKSEALILIITFLLTVLIDLAVAVQVGIVLAAIIFVKKMADKTSVEACRLLLEENRNESAGKDSDIFLRDDIPKEITVFEINGPFFYSVSDLLNETLAHLRQDPVVFILRMEKVSIVDGTGLKALQEFNLKCQRKGIHFLICGPQASVRPRLNASGITAIFNDIESALTCAKELSHHSNQKVGLLQNEQ